jgi:hypothetical protein
MERLKTSRKEFAMRTLLLLISLAMCFAIGCSNVNEYEEEIALSKVPAPALKAAEAAVDGIVIEEAVVEVEDGRTLYVLEGMADGQEYEIEVTSAGKVLEVEEEEEDEDDDEDDEDDEHEDDDDEDDDHHDEEDDD